MEKKIMYTENAPDKKFLWLHHKDGDLVLEGFGNNGWESVGKNTTPDIKEITSTILKEIKSSKHGTVKVSLPKLSEDCSKKELIRNIEKLNNALIKAGIIEI